MGGSSRTRGQVPRKAVRARKAVKKKAAMKLISQGGQQPTPAAPPRQAPVQQSFVVDDIQWLVEPSGGMTEPSEVSPDVSSLKELTEAEEAFDKAVLDYVPADD
jgi:hypothetical protein